MPTPAEFLQQAIQGHLVDLGRFDARLQGEVVRILHGLEAELVERIRVVDPAGAGRRTFKLARLERLLKQTRGTIATAYRSAQSVLDTGLQRAAAFELEFVSGSLTTALGPIAQYASVNTAAAAPELLSSLAKQTLVTMGDGLGSGYARDWIAAQETRIVQGYAGQLRRGILVGEGTEELVRRIAGGGVHDGVMPISRRWARSIVRTSSTAVTAEARQMVYRANPDTLKGFYQITVEDDRTTLICMTYSGLGWVYGPGGELIPVDHGLSHASGVPRHIGCFPGDTLTAPIGNLQAASERPYQGDLVVLRTAAGRTLRCTPNHPILTNRGFVAAKDLDLGEQLVHKIVGEWDSIPGADYLVEDMEAPIEEICRSDRKCPGMVSGEVPLSSPDFHGDVREGQVAIVRAYGQLGNRIRASISQHLLDLMLENRALRAGSLSGLGRLEPFTEWHSSTSAGDICRLGELASLICAGKVHASLLLSTAVADWYASRYQAVLGGGVWHADSEGHLGEPDSAPVEPLGGFQFGAADLFESPSRATVPVPYQHPSGLQDPADGLLFAMESPGGFQNRSGCVEFDNLLSLEVVQWSGHVYCLQTSSGMFQAGGLYVKNCRSVEAPWVKSWEEMGLKRSEVPRALRSQFDGKIPGTLSGDAILRRHTVAWQNQVLGTTRAKLWRAGTPLESFLDKKGRVINQLRIPAQRP